MKWNHLPQFKQHPFKLLSASVLGVGFLPASGTWGSLVALLILPLLMWCPFLTGIFVVLLFALGVWSIPALIKNQPNKDPSYVVIDELMGQLAVFAFIPNDFINPLTCILAFILFRLFDILKPWPVSFYDQKVHNAWGIMLDDLVAGIYALFTISIIYWLSLI